MSVGRRAWSHLTRGLRPGWLRLQPVVYGLLIAVGLAFFAWEPARAELVDDPCCHVLIPGLGPVAWGAIGLGSRWYRQREFARLVEISTSKHGFAANERRLREMARDLPPSYRERLDELRCATESRGKP